MLESVSGVMYNRKILSVKASEMIQGHTDCNSLVSLSCNMS